MKSFPVKIYPLVNTIQNYNWGSKTELNRLFNISNSSNNHQAELWIGAHYKSPSLVMLNENDNIPLNELIKAHPNAVLGEKVTNQYNGSLPYLFKVLAAEKPLSIQTHPNLNAAQHGFKKENNLGISLTDNNRNYKDQNHKPELIYAITEFHALYNFKTPENIKELLLKTGSSVLKDLTKYLDIENNRKALKQFYQQLMGLKLSDKTIIVSDILKCLKKGLDLPELETIAYLNQHYPNDFGIIAPLYMNRIVLQPGESMFIEPGEIHTYLQGTGIEIMANSDNVIRGGLTNKNMDIDELIRVLNFTCNLPGNLSITSSSRETIQTIQPEVNEFGFSIIDLTGQSFQQSPKSVELLFCSEGKPRVRDLQSNDELIMGRGDAFLIPAALKTYILEGTGKIMRTFIP